MSFEAPYAKWVRFLLTNDDGIDAPGLAALQLATREIGDALVVAPTGAHSGCSHRVTTHESFAVRPLTPVRYAVEGTPADCIRVAIHDLVQKPIWVLAGINEGGNLGADVHHSGTVAAVREAVLHGYPGVAFSQYKKRGMPIDWNLARKWAEVVLAKLVQEVWLPGTYWNVNLPHLDPIALTPEIVHCPLDTSPLPLDFKRDGDRWLYQGNYHLRQRQPGSDVSTCFDGKIAITRLSL